MLLGATVVVHKIRQLRRLTREFLDMASAPDDGPEDDNDTPPTDLTTPKGGLFGGAFDSSGLEDPNVRSLLMDYHWVTTLGGTTAATVIKYAFPTEVTDFTEGVPGGYPDTKLLEKFEEVSDEQEAAALAAMHLVASYTKLKFEEADSPSAVDATLRFSGLTDGSSQAAFPANPGPYSSQDARESGDNWLSTNGRPPEDFYGTDDFNTIMHEMGHALGLKHGHDSTYNGALAADKNDNEFSVMTYASYFGANTSTATEAHPGSSPHELHVCTSTRGAAGRITARTSTRPARRRSTSGTRPPDSSLSTATRHRIRA